MVTEVHATFKPLEPGQKIPKVPPSLVHSCCRSRPTAQHGPHPPLVGIACIWEVDWDARGTHLREGRGETRHDVTLHGQSC